MPEDRPSKLEELARLIEIVTRLRAPDGCPWDREQTEQTMAPHLLEEAYEAVDAIVAGSAEHAKEELGDVLMNVFMIAEIAAESDRFDLGEVARGIAEKLVRRHPHVFGDLVVDDADEVLANWEAIKRREHQDRGVLDGVPRALPALLRAFRVGEKAARVGFDWRDMRGPRAKVDEELAELDLALAGDDQAAREAEIGDLLLSVVSVARHCGVNPEVALRSTVDRFVRRFQYIERELGERLEEASLDEKEALWQAAKKG